MRYVLMGRVDFAVVTLALLHPNAGALAAADEPTNTLAQFQQALPQFEGKTTPDADTGLFESTLLSAKALRVIAQKIAVQIAKDKQPVLILTGDENFSFGTASAMNAGLKGLHDTLCKPPIVWSKCSPDRTAPLTPLASVIGTIAGALRSDVSLQTLTATAIDSRMLADAVAAAMNKDGRVAHIYGGSPGIKVSKPDLSGLDNQDAWIASTRIADKYAWLLTMRELARPQSSNQAEAPAARDMRKANFEALTKWTDTFDTFDTRVTKAGDDGTTPLGRAIKADLIDNSVKSVVRVDVEIAGGSLKNSKNLLTFFGADPLRVTGGVLASFRLYESDNQGTWLTKWQVWSCASEEMRLKRVPSAGFKKEEVLSKVNECGEVTSGV